MSQYAIKPKEDAIDVICKQITKLTGVVLGEKQRPMVESRLKKRFSEVGVTCADGYLRFLNEHLESETQVLIGLLTTHYTYFFREFSQFEYLAEQVLPKLVPIVSKRKDKTLKVWSAACSRGHEVYSLAMFLKYHLRRLDPTVTFQILGTDIDPQSVKIAQNGVYAKRELDEAPLIYLSDHWARGTGEISDFVKAKVSLRNHVRFETANLMNLKARFDHTEFDVIFCRNVFIYFTPEQIKASVSDLQKFLNKAGALFVGISESLNGLGLSLKSKGPSVYVDPAYEQIHEMKKAVSSTQPAVTGTTKSSQPSVSKIEPARPLRVLCVDDSMSIHTLMKQVLKKDEGFEIVGVALNGIQAAQKLKEIPDVDVMTLDIHMPEMDGIQYLQKHFSTKHPPVVMITSVSRDSSDLAFKSLELGASDFIEKPALNNLNERGDEIRMKLKSAFKLKAAEKSLSLDREFKRAISIENPEKKVRIIVSSVGDQKKLGALIQDLGKSGPPTFILIEGGDAVLPTLATSLSKLSGSTVRYVDELKAKEPPHQIVLMDFKKCYDALRVHHAGDLTSIMVLGEVSKQGASKIIGWGNAQLLLEDLGQGKGAEGLTEIASDIFPVTSFAYVSSQFFGGKK